MCRHEGDVDTAGCQGQCRDGLGRAQAAVGYIVCGGPVACQLQISREIIPRIKESGGISWLAGARQVESTACQPGDETGNCDG